MLGSCYIVHNIAPMKNINNVTYILFEPIGARHGFQEFMSGGALYWRLLDKILMTAVKCLKTPLELFPPDRQPLSLSTWWGRGC